MNAHVIYGLLDELEKVGKVFGRSSPDDVFSETEIPLHLKKQVLMDYVRDKRKERPSSLGRSMLLGSGVGAGLGALAGLAASRSVGGSALGLGIGGLLGAGTGWALQHKDKNEIEKLRQINLKDKRQVDALMARRIAGARRTQRNRDELRKELRKDLRNQRLIAAISSGAKASHPRGRIIVSHSY